MKKRFAMMVVLVVALVMGMILPINNATAKAASDKPVLEVTVTDEKSGNAYISGIDIPEILEYKYDGYEGGNCPYYFDILFGDYGVCMDIKARELMDYAERTGEFTFPIIAMEANCVSYNSEENSTSELLDCNVEVSYADKRLCYKFSFTDKYDVDLTKVSSYSLITGVLGDSQENNFAAVSGNVVKGDTEKEDKESSDTEKKVKAPAKVKLSSAKVSENKIALKWNKVSGVAGYKIYYSETKKGTYTEIATVKGANKKSYTTDKLSNGTYYFKVRAYKEVDGKQYYGGYSAVKSAKVTSATSWDGVYVWEDTEDGEKQGIRLELSTSKGLVNYNMIEYVARQGNATFETYDSFYVKDEKNSSFTGYYVNMKGVELENLMVEGTFTIKKTSSKKISMTITRDGESKEYVLTKAK